MNLHKLTEIAVCGPDETTVIPAELAGYAAQAAVKILLQNWIAALGDGNKDNLPADIDKVISILRDVQKVARATLPFENGGLEGQSEAYWLSRLKPLGVFVYASETSPGFFGYTGCESDSYETEQEAVCAAVANNRMRLISLTA